MTFSGYARPCGKVGTRNLVGVLPVVFCANHVCRKIASAVAGAVAFPHPAGCGYPGPDHEMTAFILRRIAEHPNLGAVLLVGLGCERVTFEDVLAGGVGAVKPVACISIQSEGGSLKTVAKGSAIAEDFSLRLARQKREPFPLSELVLGLKCGGTDAASGLAANPALGVASDLLVQAGGSSILTEITELCGTQDIMARRAVDEKTAEDIRDCVARNLERLNRATAAVGHGGRAVMLVSPGNADGGVTNVVEKALGGLKKAGKAPFRGVTDYGAPLPGKGLYLMDGPGHDAEAVSGLVAAGATVVAFTTGRGTPTGFPGVPVLKLTGNPALMRTMGDNIDFDAGVLFSEKKSLADIGRDLFGKIAAVAGGEPAKAEILGHEELFCISRFMATHHHFEGCPKT
jgi:altronate dehydratase large subunit